MTEPTGAKQALSRFLKDLRQTWDDVNVTQKQVADAMSTSTALVSSWESGGAVPPEDRLRQYARFFCTHRSIESRPAVLIPQDDLNADEERQRADLVDALVRLREEALHKPIAEAKDKGELGGRFWYFSDEQPLTILHTPFSRRQVLGAGQEDAELGSQLTPVQQYTLNPTHPNWIRNLSNADIDGLIELVGHVRAENPSLDTKWRPSDTIIAADDYTGHTVILGGGDSLLVGAATGTVGDLWRLMELPIEIQQTGDDEEFDIQFVVTTDDNGDPAFGGPGREFYGPRFRRDESSPGRPRILRHGVPVLEYDAALIARRPNPLNAAATVTVCTGLFSRGTYGAVRAFTDASLRTRNEEYVTKNLDPERFWMLIQVPVFGGERTITPDLSRPVHRLKSSS